MRGVEGGNGGGRSGEERDERRRAVEGKKDGEW